MQQTSPIDKYHLRLATIIHAQTLNALDRPLESRSYLRLVLRLFPSLIEMATQTTPGANKIVLQSQHYFNLTNDYNAFETRTLHATLAQAELHICTSSRYGTHLCNVSSVVHHSRLALQTHDLSLEEMVKNVPAQENTQIEWGNVLKRKDLTHRTHIVPLCQKIKHDLRQMNYILQVLSSPATNKPPAPTTPTTSHQLLKLQNIYWSYQQLYSILKTEAATAQLHSDWNKIDHRLNALLRNEHKAIIASTYGKIIHVPVPMQAKPHLKLTPKGITLTSVLALHTKQERLRIEQTYLKTGIAVVDRILTEPALEALRSYVNGATIFHDPRMGYMGAYGQSGLLLDQTMVMVAAAMGRMFPTIMCGRPMVQMWVYKYDQTYNFKHQSNVTNSGISLHADDAQINVNIWLTKSSSAGGARGGEKGKERSNGGLLLYPELKSTVKDLFSTFNSNPPMDIVQQTTPATSATIEAPNERVVKVMHQANRMVLFDSAMYHQSDQGMNSFGEEFSEQRINLTLLFGRRKDTIARRKVGGGGVEGSRIVCVY